jgi:hypothetical protein
LVYVDAAKLLTLTSDLHPVQRLSSAGDGSSAPVPQSDIPSDALQLVIDCVRDLAGQDLPGIEAMAVEAIQEEVSYNTSTGKESYKHFHQVDLWSSHGTAVDVHGLSSAGLSRKPGKMRDDSSNAPVSQAVPSFSHSLDLDLSQRLMLPVSGEGFSTSALPWLLKTAGSSDSSNVDDVSSTSVMLTRQDGGVLQRKLDGGSSVLILDPKSTLEPSGAVAKLMDYSQKVLEPMRVKV